MREKLYRFVYDDPEWSVLVPASMMVKGVLARMPTPDRVVYAGEWNIETDESTRADEDES